MTAVMLLLYSIIMKLLKAEKAVLYIDSFIYYKNYNILFVTADINVIYLLSLCLQQN